MLNRYLDGLDVTNTFGTPPDGVGGGGGGGFGYPMSPPLEDMEDGTESNSKPFDFGELEPAVLAWDEQFNGGLGGLGDAGDGGYASGVGNSDTSGVFPPTNVPSIAVSYHHLHHHQNQTDDPDAHLPTPQMFLDTPPPLHHSLHIPHHPPSMDTLSDFDLHSLAGYDGVHPHHNHHHPYSDGTGSDVDVTTNGGFEFDDGSGGGGGRLSVPNGFMMYRSSVSSDGYFSDVSSSCGGDTEGSEAGDGS
ncbi:hypothetical protein HK104_007513, partial [Borealophlyctis nickersoniae]